MAFHWSLKKDIHNADPKKGGGYHCHLLFKNERTPFITTIKVKKSVKFVYLEEHGKGRYDLFDKPKESAKRLIGQLTLKKLKKISTNSLQIPSKNAELIYTN